MSSSGPNNPQTNEPPKGIFDSATTTARDVLDSVTGNKRESDNDQGKSPPPPTGQYDQTLGSAKQSLGTAIGNDSLRRQGEAQLSRGQDQEAQRQVHDWGEGVGDRVKGKVGTALSGAGFGGTEEERLKQERERAEWKDLHDQGKERQMESERDIQRRWGQGGEEERK
ncbi:hypothetical protein AJ80_02844 [Polytolypa hystricis UAMH7299]|uniref:CsbD-like domain-containing protein n=1 Tax=Polytolypa hystricis (strain UAMH7299) TaxID=1447883 RepID=A0A2B7YPF4_POLH7|nr:hypothetical protein AJ80_02844 [Polytolypa hystricis UAMH7299]